MSPIELRIHDLRASVSFADGTLRLSLVGTADASAEPAVSKLLTRIHAELLQASVREALIDIRALEFMNSSCFQAFIAWIIAVDHLPPGQRHRMRFLYDPTLQWQKRSLKAMVYFASDIVTVETG